MVCNTTLFHKDNCILLNFKVFQQISYKNEVFFTPFFSDMAFLSMACNIMQIE